MFINEVHAEYQNDRTEYETYIPVKCRVVYRFAVNRFNRYVTFDMMIESMFPSFSSVHIYPPHMFLLLKHS